MVHAPDIYVVSPLKSGRTWLRLLLIKILEYHFHLPESRDLEFHKIAGPGIPNIRFSHDDDAYLKTPGELKRDKSWYKDRHLIFLCRDPRDTIVSHYFHARYRFALHGHPLYQKTISEFIRERRGSLASLIEFLNIWGENWKNLNSKMLVRYEDLSADCKKQVAVILSFMDLRVPRSTIAKSVEFAKFSAMKKREARGKYLTNKLTPVDPANPESYKSRRGKVGGFVDYLSREDQEFCRRQMERLHPLFGYKPSQDD